MPEMYIKKVYYKDEVFCEFIDDKPENIDRWKAAGGIAIRFQCNEDDIEEYLFPAIKEALLHVNS